MNILSWTGTILAPVGQAFLQISSKLFVTSNAARWNVPHRYDLSPAPANARDEHVSRSLLFGSYSKSVFYWKELLVYKS